MKNAKHVVFTGGKIVTPEAVIEGSVEIKDGKIVRVGSFQPQAGSGAKVVDASGAYIMPGLIDMHINDGVALLEKISSPSAHADRLEKVSRDLVKLGITGIFPTTLAGPLDEIVDYLEGMAEFRRRWQDEPMGTELCGALIEGTFMNPDNCGAQNPTYMFRPDRKILDRMLDTGVVRLVNVAPEFGDASLELIDYLISKGVVAAAGHCKPTADQMVRAMDHGTSYFIHMLNGPTGNSTKSFDNGGTLQAALRDDRMSVELIVDLVHVDGRVVRDVISRKGAQRVIAISDSMFPTDAPEDVFEINGVLGRVDHEGNYLYVTGRRDSEGNVVEIPEPEIQTCDASVLFGAIVNMNDVFENLVKILSVELEGNWVRSHPAHSLDESVRLASTMCSTVPARVSGMCDGAWGRKVGAVQEGFEADIVVAEVTGGDSATLTPRQVYVAGKKFVG
jgi:N-acetylglucosamine-6-phosphate deacetylase